MWNTIQKAFRKETQRELDQANAGLPVMQYLESRTMFSVSPFAPVPSFENLSDLTAVTRPQIIGILIAL